MRPFPEHALAALAVIATAAAVYSAREGLTDLIGPTPSADRAAATLEALAREKAPTFDFALDELPQWQVDPVLVDAARAYPGTLQYCDAGSFSEWEDVSATKGRIWFEFSNNPQRGLPRDFFEQPPFLHLSGRSYVGLALERYPKRFDRDWLKRHKSRLHISELALATSLGLTLQRDEALVAMLDPKDLASMLRGDEVVLLPSWALVRSTSGREGASARYAAYSRPVWDDFAIARAFSTSRFREGAACIARTGTVCWQPDTSRAAREVRTAGLLGVLALLVFAAAGLSRRERLRRGEDRARRFILQTLTHELRTPAASLGLSLETLRRQFDDLPEEAQGAFLRMCEDMRRLRRITEASTQYLRGDGSGRGLEFRVVDIPSVQDFVRSLIEGYDVAIELRAPSAPIAVRADPYWLGVCLTNLLDNAVRHGREPISVVCACRDDDLTLAVEDGGGPSMAPSQMLAPFSKSERSVGLGLGLSVVAQVVEQMGGELRIGQDPTRFAMYLPNLR